MCPIHDARYPPTALRPPFEAWDFQRAGFISVGRLQDNTVQTIHCLSFDRIEVGSQCQAVRVSTANRSAASFARFGVCRVAVKYSVVVRA